MRIERLFGFDRPKNLFDRIEKEIEKIDKTIESFSFSEQLVNGYELEQNDEEVTLKVNIPGSNPSNTTVEFDGSSIAVLAKGKRSKYKMPSNIDANSITASMQDGVLCVRAKTNVKQNTVKIPIN